ncbi:MAG: hypothetical protein JNK02_04485 [Planctomycetes bacterium]|nr:hypothetical protein [Planctomycetota bacterium]
MLNPAHALLLTALAGPADEPVATRVLPIAATDVQVRLPLPGWRDDVERRELMRKSSGEYLLAAGWLGSDDVRVTIHGGPAPSLDGDACRKGALGDRLIGMGISTIAGFAAAERVHALNPPYREHDRHVFLIGAGALAHVQAIALEGEPPDEFPPEAFEAIARGARFAVVRRTAWDDLPAAYLELSHLAALRADGVAWLRERASAEGADWIVRLAATEHAHAAHVGEAWVAELARSLLTQLGARETRDRHEQAGLFLAEDGLALALARAGAHEEAAAHASRARSLAASFGARALAGVSATEACVAAARADADLVVKHLEAAYAQDPALRYRLQREPLLERVRADPRVTKLLEVKLAPRSGRSFGR